MEHITSMPEFDRLSFEEKRAVRIVSNMNKQGVLNAGSMGLLRFNVDEFIKRMDRSIDTCEMVFNKIIPFVQHFFRA